MSEDLDRSEQAAPEDELTPEQATEEPSTDEVTNQPSVEEVLDPFVSQEDPYPYEEMTSTNPDDTSAYLAAALESQQSQEAMGAAAAASSYEETDKYQDVSRYRHQRMAQQRKRGIRVAILVFVALVLLFGAAAGVYIANINAKLTENVTSDLREQLVETKAGNPFYLLLLGIDKDQGRVEDTEHYGADEHAYRSDSIMLCRIDPKNVKVTMVSIHRDTAIDMDEHGLRKDQCFLCIWRARVYHADRFRIRGRSHIALCRG